MKTKQIIFSFLIAASTLININAQGVGDAAPDFSFDILNGGKFTLSEQSGKVVFIFLFGYSCSTCEQNGPNTQTQIYNVYKDNPQFVAIGVDVWDGNESGVQGFKSTTEIEYPLLLKGSSLLQAYSSSRDRAIVIDQEGIIQYKSTNLVSKAIAAEAGVVIGSLLEGTTAFFSTPAGNNNFRIMPSMANNSISFINPFGIGEQVQLNITDITGKSVLESNIQMQEINEVEISFLNPGYYSVILSNKGEFHTSKFIKTND